jgi:exonuclease VII large subunit
MSLTESEKNRLKKVGLSGLNKPKRTPKHPKKKAVVAVRDGEKVKIILGK